MLVPRIGHYRQMRIECRSQASEQIGQRILEVAVLALAESVPSHVDVTAEEFFLRIQRGNFPALVAGKQFIDHRATETVQIRSCPVPIVLFQSGFSGLHCSGVRIDDAVLFHAIAPSFLWSEARSSFVACNPILARVSRVEGTFRRSAAPCSCRGDRPRPSRAAARFRRLPIVLCARDLPRPGWRYTAAHMPWRDSPPLPSRRVKPCGVSLSPKRSPSVAHSDSCLQTQRAPRRTGFILTDRRIGCSPSLRISLKALRFLLSNLRSKETEFDSKARTEVQATRSHLTFARTAQFDRGEAQ